MTDPSLMLNSLPLLTLGVLACLAGDDGSNVGLPERTWWKEGIVYQIYPRSFVDSNGDGIGDLPGIISKLDYLKQLGVDILWICPIFSSPNVDNGYDVSDYLSIMGEFGTMADFDRLVTEMKQRGLRLILDLVPNHSSDRHPWFAASRKSKDNPFREYYFWRPGKRGRPPNNWRSLFSGPAWELDQATGEYYLHLFAKQQPDLNWENPKVRSEIYDVMRFWLDRGISGWRIDVVPFLSKNLVFPDYPPGFDGDLGRFHANGPRLHEFLREMHREVLSRYDMTTVAEGIGQTTETGPLLVDRRRGELHMLYHFDHMFLDRAVDDFFRVVPYRLEAFKAIFAKWDLAVGSHGWASVLLGNHDFPRMVSRWGDDGQYREQSAKMLATLLLTQRGTPHIYQGDELGMTNAAFASIEEMDDIQTRNAYAEFVACGGDPAQFLLKQNATSRDHARTPFQWDDSENAGFSRGKPWLRVNPNYPRINAAQQLGDSESVLRYYQRAIRLRKENRTLVYGSYRDIDPKHPLVFAYTRDLGNERMLVVLHFSREDNEYMLPEGIRPRELLLSNYAVTENRASAGLQLKAYEGRVYRL
jgi:oligo-1,6-glucosidase